VTKQQMRLSLKADRIRGDEPRPAAAGQPDREENGLRDTSSGSWACASSLPVAAYITSIGIAMLKASTRPPAASEAARRSVAKVRCAANPIGGERMRQDCGSGASRLVPATVLENAASGGRGARRSCIQMELHQDGL
jgi:hypothetical protein